MNKSSLYTILQSSYLLYYNLHTSIIVYNNVNISKISIHGLADIVAEITNSEVALGESPNLLKGAPDDVKLDLTKILKLANYENFINLETGLMKTINWAQSIYKQNKELGIK